jgi:large subunit ribosomal protein L1
MSGKKLRAAYEGLDLDKLYELQEALNLVKTKAFAKFDETLEISIRLNIDPRKAEQAMRGMMNLPKGTGKIVKIAVFARGPKAEEAKAAGADIVGAEDLKEAIMAGNIDFNRCIATPDMMGVVGSLGKILAPRGLMPNPKLGTVTMDISKAIQNAKAGQAEYRNDKSGVVNIGIGKISFSLEDLIENARFVIDTITKARPAGIKGTYMKTIAVSSTMGIGLKVSN